VQVASASGKWRVASFTETIDSGRQDSADFFSQGHAVVDDVVRDPVTHSPIRTLRFTMGATSNDEESSVFYFALPAVSLFNIGTNRIGAGNLLAY
jgi:hypothetical protein